ncbi:MAG: AMP-binding protein [Bdellovibrionota bacterium]|nr:AMP-binding protein [Bdellovibrionota bacterium]
MERIWQKSYPAGVDLEIDLKNFKNIKQLVEEKMKVYAGKEAFHCMGKDLTFSDLDTRSKAFACYLTENLGLKKGDRIAIQMPNVLQFPIALFGAVRAGLVVVNTNPLYTEREMEHQFKDAGVKAIVILANFADKLEKILPKTSIKHVIVTELGDQLGFPKSLIVNKVVKHIKKMVPNFHLPQAIDFNHCIKWGRGKRLRPVEMELDDTAILQYTGGTTGVAKGAELTHRNLLSNMMQIRCWMRTALKEGEEVILTPLPLYHVFSFTVNLLAFTYLGCKNVLITNPRDIPGFIKEMKAHKFTVMTGLNTLFNALMNHPEFSSVDFSPLKISVAGGMAMQKAVMERWLEKTGTHIAEGYGLTETSPVLCCNPIDGSEKVGSIGLPLPSTDIMICDDDGNEVPMGEAGELWAKGPQVMKGYWNRPDETEKIITNDGWLKTGDVAMVDEQGYFKIVDRKKDMILVSGFNVYPNEIEDVVVKMEKVLEVAAIGVPDERSGEVVKVFVVKKDDGLTAEEILNFCKENLTGYKRPKFVEFRDELPKSNVGKILRKEL